MLFRVVFFRSTSEHVSIFYLSLVFAVSTSGVYPGHSHKLFYKIIRGKEYILGPYIGQMVFTFLFSLYCSFVLMRTHQLLAVVLLHAYCNMLGPPRFNKGKRHLTKTTGADTHSQSWASHCS